MTKVGTMKASGVAGSAIVGEKSKVCPREFFLEFPAEIDNLRLQNTYNQESRA